MEEALTHISWTPEKKGFNDSVEVIVIDGLARETMLGQPLNERRSSDSADE